MRIFREFSFQAAHSLPNVPPGHKCARLHGHSYRVEVHIEGLVDGHSGMIMDFAELKNAFTPIYQVLDHHLLNDVEGLENPTSENLAYWLWDRLIETLPLAEIIVRETSNSGVSYRGEAR